MVSFQAHGIPDLMRTSVEHICDCLVQAIQKSFSGSCPRTALVTGGGALNRFLMGELRQRLGQTEPRLIIGDCDVDTVQFKEALTFSFLGVRCLLGLTNVSSAVTGAIGDTVSGSIHLPPGHGALLGWLLSSNSAHDAL